jgi:uncharacterized membrane protein YfcA
LKRIYFIGKEITIQTYLELILPILFFIIAFLYSAVGHAGATGYIAVMTLAGIMPDEIRPAALVLNILVASIASYKYLKARCFSLRVFLLFAIASIPFSFLGGTIQLPLKEMKLVLGLVLGLSALLMVLRVYLKPDYEVKQLPIPMGISIGSIIGFLSGLTSIGGGVFLSPMLVFFRWSSIKNASGIAALFILVNSIAGLTGQLTKGIQVSHSIWFWAIAVILGGYIGAELGSKKFNNKIILGFLFCVLIIAALKMFVSA